MNSWTSMRFEKNQVGRAKMRDEIPRTAYSGMNSAHVLEDRRRNETQEVPSRQSERHSREKRASAILSADRRDCVRGIEMSIIYKQQVQASTSNDLNESAHDRDYNSQGPEGPAVYIASSWVEDLSFTDEEQHVDWLPLCAFVRT
ncbi:hypothetical protein Ae201684P_001435 [Aphanomyces euteiches]|nr:hypothetical protein Ae201684P_001435 [Aphanomyces euteiches]